jgi:hypothetical protein
MTASLCAAWPVMRCRHSRHVRHAELRKVTASVVADQRRCSCSLWLKNQAVGKCNSYSSVNEFTVIMQAR